MPKGHSINFDALHSYLYRRTDRLGRLQLHQTELAEEFGITKYTMSRVIAKMVQEKRLKRLTNNLNNRGMFVVTDPEVWQVAYGAEE